MRGKEKNERVLFVPQMIFFKILGSADGVSVVLVAVFLVGLLAGVAVVAFLVGLGEGLGLVLGGDHIFGFGAVAGFSLGFLGGHLRV